MYEFQKVKVQSLHQAMASVKYITCIEDLIRKATSKRRRLEKMLNMVSGGETWRTSLLHRYTSLLDSHKQILLYMINNSSNARYVNGNHPPLDNALREFVNDYKSELSDNRFDEAIAPIRVLATEACRFLYGKHHSDSTECSEPKRVR